MERNGFKTGVKRSIGKLQDPARIENCGGAAEECHGQRYEAPVHVLRTKANERIVNKKDLVKQLFNEGT